jgi:CheY-like chemotaxis protein
MKQRVLIVEDDELLRDIYSYRLEMEGYDVAVAHDGLEGLEKIEAVIPDLIILDMMMPRLDGMGFLAKFSKRPEAKHSIILVASNKSSMTSIEEAKRLGARDYLIKSQLTPDDLAEHVRKHLAAAAK